MVNMKFKERDAAQVNEMEKPEEKLHEELLEELDKIEEEKHEENTEKTWNCYSVKMFMEFAWTNSKKKTQFMHISILYQDQW